MARICLICPHAISFQPRSLREADLFSEAGHDVRVIVRHQDPVLAESDRQLARTRKWRMESVDLCRSVGRRYWTEAIKSKIAAALFNAGIRTDSVAASGAFRGLREARELASSEAADWFIAHTQLALPIAVAAAQKWGARVGFDCEDVLGMTDDRDARMIRQIESAYVSRCDYVTVASAEMSAHLRREHGLTDGVVLYNVFPLRLADGMAPPHARLARDMLRLHWFGQTIGPDRGLSDALSAIFILGDCVELHLRGNICDAYRDELTAQASRHGASGRLFFHPRIAPDQLIASMIEFDVGLALEQPGRANYAMTVTNKLFSYALAGLAIAATNTPGQREAFGQTPGAGFLYNSGDSVALAEGLRSWLLDRNALLGAQSSAWDIARKRFCWDIEGVELMNTIER